ncbi:MAG: hypothetical protein CMP22_07505 [Rickettsiales bacterium]|nr:hypothetical protein [Rickettsiales bacterium]
MATYFAISSKDIKCGGLTECIQWAHTLVQSNKAKIIKVIRVRSCEKSGRVIMDISRDGICPVKRGRLIAVSKVRKIIKDGA